MDRKRKHFVASGGFKKKRNEYLQAARTFSTESTLNSSKNVEEAAVNTANTNSGLSDGCDDTTELVNIEPSSSENVYELLESANSVLLDNCENSELSEIDEIQETLIEGSDSIPFNINQFQLKLASWAVTNKVKHDQLRDLLKLWNECVPLPQLPADPRTVLATPRKVHIENNYWHYGLKKKS